MQIFRSRVASSLAVLAVLTMTATPALAHGRGDWGRHRHYRGNGISGGDLLAGLLVIGGVAAIASAASKKSDEQQRDRSSYPGGPDDYDRDYERSADSDQGYGDEPPPSSSDYGSRDYPGGPAGAQGSFDGAVDACSAELERGSNRIDSVDGVRRMGDRYSVEGRLGDGRGYACSVDDTGHIRSVAVDGHAMI